MTATKHLFESKVFNKMCILALVMNASSAKCKKSIDVELHELLEDCAKKNGYKVERMSEPVSYASKYVTVVRLFVTYKVTSI